MSQISPETIRELSCPNCGAPYTLPTFGNQVICAYCGTRFLIPASIRVLSDASRQVQNETITLDATPAVDAVQVRRWVRWLVIFIVVTTVVPTLCGVGAALCGLLAPLAAFLFGR